MARDIKQRLLGELIESAVWHIPDNQRDFVWKQDQAIELLEDLLSYSKSVNESPFYLGNFITLTEDNERDERLPIFQLVDGQQRMTALMMIHIAMRIKLYELDQSHTALKIQERLMVLDGNGEDKKCRFVPSDSIADLMEQASTRTWQNDEFQKPENIDGRTFRSRRLKFQNAYRPIWDIIKKLDKDLLCDLNNTIGETEISHVHLTTLAEAIELFERNNARGIQLDAANLVKNHLFSRQDIPQLVETWEKIEQNTNKGGTITALKYFHTSKKGTVSKKELYGKLKGVIENMGSNEFIQELEEFSGFFQLMTDSEENYFADKLSEFGLDVIVKRIEFCRQMIGALQAIKFFNVRQVIPILYSAIKSASEKDGNGDLSSRSKSLIAICQMLEKFHAVYSLVCTQPHNAIEKVYAQEAAKISDNKNLNDSEKRLRNKFTNSELTVQKEIFAVNFESISYGSSIHDKAKIRYIFDRLGNFEVKGPLTDIFQPSANPTAIHEFSIDHVYAQNIKNDYAQLKNDPETINSIGNLFVLLKTDNSTLSNKTPAEKFEILKGEDNPTYISRFLNEVTQYDEPWGKETIETRTRKLAEKCYDEVFKIA